MKFDYVFPESNEAGLFLKIEDGQRVKGVFRGDISVKRTHWFARKPSPCLGLTCSHCEAGDKPKTRFVANFVTRDDKGEFIAKLFEFGKTIYESLRDLNEAGYDIPKTTVMISRKGKELETEWSVVSVNGGAVTPAMEDQIARIPLHELEPRDNKDFAEGDSVPF